MEPLDLYDGTRDRRVPVSRHSAPGSPRACLLLSVGFGGGREGYGYLARHWAQAGFTTLVVEHVGSNLEALRPLRQAGQRQEELAQRVAQAVRDPVEQRQRLADLEFVRAQQAWEGPWGLTGHSYGAATVLRVAPDSGAFAVIALSPPSPREFPYQALPMPVLLLTGTRDSFAIPVSERLGALDHMAAGRSALAIVEGADHMGLAGVGLNLAPQLERVQLATTCFLEAALAGLEPLDPQVEGVQWRLR